MYLYTLIVSTVELGGILERIQYLGACLIALKVFFHPCNNPRFARIVTRVKENLEGNSASSQVYDILSKIIAFPLLLLVIGVLLGTSYCGINIRSMLDNVDLRLFYLNGKIIIYVCISIH